MPSQMPNPDEDLGADISEGGETVLTSGRNISADDFPPGMNSRELSLALQGERLHHFQLQQFVGGGGMGVVFKALDTTLNRTVAVKVVASQSISKVDLQRRFEVEAQSTARLDHPNIAHIYLVGKDRGLSFIVFEYVEGENLRDMVANHGRIPLGDALGYTYQIAHALDHAWQREVVHRDIKPSNILVTPSGQAKLVDMGLARLYQRDTRVDDDLTSTGVTLGTFDYISPEQALDPRNADSRSDIYSLGCTLFYLLAGRAPFAQGTAAQKLLQHQDERPPDLHTLCVDVPESIGNMVHRMLAKPPEERHQSPMELIAELAETMSDLELPIPQSLGPLSTRPRPWRMAAWKKHVPWAVPLVALGGVVSWFGIGGGQEPEAFELPPIPAASENDFSDDHSREAIEPSATAEENTSTSLSGESPSGTSATEGFQIDVGSIFEDEKLVPASEPSVLDPWKETQEVPSQPPLQSDSAEDSITDESLDGNSF